MDMVGAVTQVLTGLRMIGDSVTYMITYALNIFGLKASEETVKLITTLFLFFFLVGLGSKLSKLIFFIVAVFLLAQVTSLSNIF